MTSNRFFKLGLITAIGLNFFSAHIFADDFDATTETVGRSTNGFVTPVNQRLTPAGIFVELPA